MFEGRVVHKASNALKMTFTDGPGEPFAVGVQSAGDGKRSKVAVLFGFKNGGAGKHVVTFEDGTVLGVESKDGAPSVFTVDGEALATVVRGDESVVNGTDGTPILRLAADPAGVATSPDQFPLIVTDPQGSDIGRLDVIRTVQGWSVWSFIEAVDDLTIWWDRAGAPLPVPILGARVSLYETPGPVVRNVLVGACVDIAIGLRPYAASMR